MSPGGAAVRASPAAKFLVGLIGEGIQGSRSPALHEQEARNLGFALHYQLIDLARDGRSAADLPRLLDAAQAVGFAGVNITHPCKQAVLPLLDRLSPDAQAIGAVNTVVFHGGERVGHNTDWTGFATPFRRALDDVALDRVSLLGAGGTGAAVAHAILTLGAVSSRSSIPTPAGPRRSPPACAHASAGVGYSMRTTSARPSSHLTASSTRRRSA